MPKRPPRMYDGEPDQPFLPWFGKACLLLMVGAGAFAILAEITTR